MSKLIDIKKRVFIKNDASRTKEIIEKLESLGANHIEYYGTVNENKESIYFIDNDNEITICLPCCDLYPFIKEYYKEIILPFKLKDKQLVWCWNYDGDFYRTVAIYDAQNNCTFSCNGIRNGAEYKHYAPYNGPIEPWMASRLIDLRDK